MLNPKKKKGLGQIILCLINNGWIFNAHTLLDLPFPLCKRAL